MAAIPAPKAPEQRPQAPDRIQARVDAAAFALMREGRNPTVNAVRERMGGGSPNVVAPALLRWRHGFAGRLSDNASSAAELLPPGVQELVDALWSRALFEAHRVAAETRTDSGAQEQMAAAINALKAATARVERREAELETLTTSRSRRPNTNQHGRKPEKKAATKARKKPTRNARVQKARAKGHKGKAERRRV